MIQMYGTYYVTFSLNITKSYEFVRRRTILYNNLPNIIYYRYNIL